AALDSSFQASPNLRSHKLLPRNRAEIPSPTPTGPPRKDSSQGDEDDPMSEASSATSLPSISTAKGAENGLPPTPPSNSLDGEAPVPLSPPPHADSVVSSLLSKKSSLSTPVNNRSPPTPDPSPPRTTESMKTPDTSTRPERPPMLAYPSSRAESFMTAKEELNSSDIDSGLSTPLGDRLSMVAEERGLGLAFERDDGDVTPTAEIQDPFETPNEIGPTGEENKDPLSVEEIPDREWDTNLMRNVTIRRKRRDSKPSPQKKADPIDTEMPESPSKRASCRRTSSLRERVQASKGSPRTPSVENFARSIGWPTDASNAPDDQKRDVDTKRLSVSSTTSAVVEAMVIVTPPRRRQTLRHSGKNLAYRPVYERDEPSGDLTQSNRNSMVSEDTHRLVHKRATVQRISTPASSLRHASTPISFRRNTPIDSSAFTLAHQESVRRVLQPAADIMSRSNSVTRNHPLEKSFHKRISSAPETTRRMAASPGPRAFVELSAPESPTRDRSMVQPPRVRRTSPAIRTPGPVDASPTSPTAERRLPKSAQYSPSYDKSLPELPAESASKAKEEVQPAPAPVVETDRTPVTFHDAVSEQPAETDDAPRERPTQRRGSSAERTPTVRRGSLSTRGRSEERRRSTHSQDRRSNSGDTLLHPSMDRIPTEELPRHSSEWNHDHRRVSFDRSTSRASDEHAMARHLFAQTTPFSQISDTPIEVSEATAVSIFPHNNHSLLVVQQPARSSLMPGEEDVPYDTRVPTSDPKASEEASSALMLRANSQDAAIPDQPTVTVEPSTPPMKISLPSHVDSPLKNPRAAPVPPQINFIPPTPLDEVEALQLQPASLQPAPPGPPKRSDSHPQRRLSLKERARRYSDNFISPLLARASSTRGRYVSDPHTHQNPRVPTVNDMDGALHPFWRPRGFWDDFDESESESDDDILPRGGDTSDVEDEPEPQPPKKGAVLKRRLTNGLKGPGGFLIGNSLGVERHGSNRRRPRIDLPTRRFSNKTPKVLIQAPTLPSEPRSRSPPPHPNRVEKRISRSSPRNSSTSSLDRPRRTSRRDAWRDGKRIPGVPRLQVQYIGFSGVKDRIRERRAEKRRDELRRSIGTRYYV
ncbi:hypothetical protein BU24DRAFT_322710, partial [Aaosphaeria arxii CBS 175.79]